MKNNQTIWFSFFLTFILCAGSHISAFASPVFSAKDDEPIAKSAEVTAESKVEAPQQNTSTENANLHKGTDFFLSAVNFKILSGVNRAGEKSYSATYQLAEASNEKGTTAKEPKVTVSFKSKLDKGKFAVSEITIKKLVNNAYKITAKIVESKPEETPKDPKITWLD